jgi:hypothetical protein
MDGESAHTDTASMVEPTYSKCTMPVLTSDPATSLNSTVPRSLGGEMQITSFSETTIAGAVLWLKWHSVLAEGIIPDTITRT